MAVCTASLIWVRFWISSIRTATAVFSFSVRFCGATTTELFRSRAAKGVNTLKRPTKLQEVCLCMN
jgi:hypothetical protein